MEDREKTLVETLKELTSMDYSIDFNRNPWKEKLQLNPNDFVIEKVYRFEGMTNPEDEAVLYTILSKTENIKGYLLNGYGTYTEDWLEKIIRKLERQDDYNTKK